jgi:hypothetical protein
MLKTLNTYNKNRDYRTVFIFPGQEINGDGSIFLFKKKRGQALFSLQKNEPVPIF